jgi:hypothetical protein
MDAHPFAKWRVDGVVCMKLERANAPLFVGMESFMDQKHVMMEQALVPSTASVIALQQRQGINALSLLLQSVSLSVEMGSWFLP